MDIFNSQPATEEDPDEGIKDLVEITLKKFVSTLATPPPKKKKKRIKIIEQLLHMSFISCQVTGFCLLV